MTGPLASVKFYLQCLMFTTSDGEEVWCSMTEAVSYRQAAMSRFFLEEADEPLTLRILAAL